MVAPGKSAGANQQQRGETVSRYGCLWFGRERVGQVSARPDEAAHAGHTRKWQGRKKGMHAPKHCNPGKARGVSDYRKSRIIGELRLNELPRERGGFRAWGFRQVTTSLWRGDGPKPQETRGVGSPLLPRGLVVARHFLGGGGGCREGLVVCCAWGGTPWPFDSFTTPAVFLFF